MEGLRASPFKGERTSTLSDDWEELRIRAVNRGLTSKDSRGRFTLWSAACWPRTIDRARSTFRGKVLDSLSSLDDPELAPIVLKAFPAMSPELKPRAIELLTQRPSWIKALLAAIDDKRIPAIGAQRQPAPTAPVQQGP